jgi:hypothetical protein
MKSYNDYYYAQINVRCGRKNGYSFMVKSKEDLDEDEILNRAKAKGLFDDDDDADGAGIVTDDLFDSDIDDMKNCTYEI